MVLSHHNHCVLPLPKTENSTVPWTRYVHVMVGGVAMHTIKKWKFLLKAFQPFIRNFALTKISRYTVYRALVKECPWAGEPYILAEEGVGALSSVSAFNPKECPPFILRDWGANVLVGGGGGGGGGRRGPSELTELEQPHDMIVLLNSQHLALTLYTRKAITNLHACTNKSLEAVKTTFV